MALVPVAEALQRLLDGAATLPGESVALADAAGRVLAEPVVACAPLIAAAAARATT